MNMIAVYGQRINDKSARRSTANLRERGAVFPACAREWIQKCGAVSRHSCLPGTTCFNLDTHTQAATRTRATRRINSTVDHVQRDCARLSLRPSFAIDPYSPIVPSLICLFSLFRAVYPLSAALSSAVWQGQLAASAGPDTVMCGFFAKRAVCGGVTTKVSQSVF